MDFSCNVPSKEEISFKLTQNFIPSVTQFPQPPPSCDSLDYTLSRVSIQYILGESEEPKILQPSPEQSSLDKESTLKTTCADMSGLTPFKKSTKASFRQRLVSSNKSNEKPKIKRRFSVHVMSLGTPTIQKKDPLAPLNNPNLILQKAKENKMKSGSRKQLLNSKKLVEWELIELQNSIKVRGLILQSHETREKSFMRKVIQNRSNAMHPIQQIAHASQLWTDRRSYRIH